jgi:aminoglycoside/choline kinase family phosphotransferase
MAQSKENRIERFLKGKTIATDRLIRLKGDASLRSFYRIPYRRGSAVMMIRDEFQPAEDRTFVEVRDHLAASGAAVPEIYEYDEDTGVILMEDFGDLTLEERLREADEETFERFYRVAIDELLAIQISGSILRRDCVAYGCAFDRKKLMEELDFFLLHAVEGFYGASLEKGERKAIRDGFSILAARLAALPRVLNHRDYHSRNLMVVDDTLKIVDFQDARMGPCQYDLASLLRDSYTVLDGSFRRRMIDYYLNESAKRGVSWYDGDLFIEQFDLMSLQRNLKACGTFGYMATARGNKRYVESLAPTFAYVKENAPRFDFLGECMRLLGRYVPLLRRLI